MTEHFLIETVIFCGFFLLGTSLLKGFTERLNFSYTAALLLVGLIANAVVQTLHLPLHLELPSSVTFYLLLPLLLFGAAMHIHIHQLKIQFKTISFVSTFGLMVSIGVIGTLLPLLLGLPLGVSLLFGSLISATDPIAVLALFKTLGAPQRLSLLADGESMFNDATAVLVFRILSTIVVGGSQFTSLIFFATTGQFLYVFVGSIVVGALVGYLISVVLSKMNDVAVETTLTISAAFLAFAATEHYFQLSGVISSVIAGLVVGNMGRASAKPDVLHFMHTFWDFLGYVAVTAVFFFATFTLDAGVFLHQPGRWMIVIGVVLVARAVSTYLSYAVTNSFPFFKDEPDVPLAWQHILNWGGLRGVIPLVLVFTLPEDFVYKDDLFVFTFATLLSSLFINGLTIGYLLKKLGLHLPKREEEILHEEELIFDVQHALQALSELPKHEFSAQQIFVLKRELKQKQKQLEKHLEEIVTPKELEVSLRLQAIRVQREKIEELLHQGLIPQNAFYEFDSQLDLQQDALEYPEKFGSRAMSKSGSVKTRVSFRSRLVRLRELRRSLPFLKHFWRLSEEQLVQDRYDLLKARYLSSEATIGYLEKVRLLVEHKPQLRAVLNAVVKTHRSHMKKNKVEMKCVEDKQRKLIQNHQMELLVKVTENKNWAK